MILQYDDFIVKCKILAVSVQRVCMCVLYTNGYYSC